MAKTIIRVICLVAVAIGMYRTDVESICTFIALMGIVFWAIPEVCMLVFGKGDEEND